MSGVRKIGWLPKGWFWQMFPFTDFLQKVFPCRAALAEFLGPKRNEGAFAKTALLQNRPFDYSRILP